MHSGMHYSNSGWNKLMKTNDSYKYELQAIVEKGRCTIRLSFQHVAFDHDDESLIAVDTKGFLHYIELSEDVPCSKRLEKVGRASFLMFNPLCKGEVLIGLENGDIKVWKLHVCASIDESCLLSGHKLAPTHVSFYKNHCLTSSQNEVIIWHLRSYSKAHQLKPSVTNTVIKKAAFSSLGHIVVLYHNDTMQTWMFGQLDEDTKIDAKVFGIRYIRDFTFTKDGRAMMMASTKKISVISTYDWSLLKNLPLPKNLVNVRQLSVVPCPPNDGANKVVALLSSKHTLHFCDANTSDFLKAVDVISGVRKFAISPAGRYMAYIDQEGCLNVIHADKVISERYHRSKRLPEPHRPQAHKISDHLESIKQSIKRELDVKRLIPILQEFGEYPEKYRALIWSTVLKLPANRNAYVALASELTRGKLALSTLRDYPLADKNKASLLVMTMDCLVQWCPLLIQSPFLPKLAFPFLVVFQKDPLLAFELILSVLLNYCQKWFEYHPLPPLNILGIVENILLEADPALLNVFYEHGITSSQYAWPLLQTAMSEVLSGDEWLILWDHLISFRKPSLLLLCVAAYSVYSRESIISLMRSSGDVAAFYTTQGHVRAKDLLRIARRLDQEIPERMHPSRYLRNELVQLNRSGPYSLFLWEEYPKFLTETVRLTDLEKLKTQAQSQECNHKIAELAERQRLHQEAETFTRQIHKTRLNEVQKCFQEHIASLDWRLDERKKCYRDLQSKMMDYNKSVRNESKLPSSECVKPNSHKKLQHDVTKLEYEVENFLESLRSRR